MEEKYTKQSIDRFLFIKENMLNVLKDDNVKTLDNYQIRHEQI